MSTFKFANVLLEHNPRFMSSPTMYCRATESVVESSEAGAWELYGKGSFDFTTYFNALSVGKLRKYTTATAFHLHLELKGSSCTITQTTSDAFSAHPELMDDTAHNVPASDNWQTVDIDLNASDSAVLMGFQIDTDGKVFIRNGFYSLSLSREPENVELALATTTFKKEEFICNNIKLLKEAVLGCNEEIAKHFTIHVIDNGRTLDPQQREADRIHIIPNANVGGAGGFTYGMIRAMGQKPRATHVLLMDDDVAVSPESIKRTYNLLRILNDDYHEAFISGAMLNYEASAEQWEDTGYMSDQGNFQPAKPPLRVDTFDDLIMNETFRLSEKPDQVEQRYAAWWYCCIPISLIEKNGLPLPVFVRCDDAEYGVRCHPRIITMNGICIWHLSFHVRYNAAVERYQTTRNTLIAQFTTGFAPRSDFFNELNNNIRLELKKFGYENAELCLDAFEDFLKGPDFISQKGVAEETFMKANRNKEKLVPFAELQKQAEELGLSDFDINRINRQLIEGDKPRSLKQRLSDLVTDNHQRIIKQDGAGFAVIPVQGWVYPAGAIRGKQYLIVIDWYSKVGAIRKKDPVRYREIRKRYKADLKFFKESREQLEKSYSAAREKLTSLAFWKDYLGISG